MLFILVTVIFVTPFQVILIVPSGRVLPMDYATTIILLIFEGLEIIFCILTMIKVSKRQSAVFYLRNSQTMIINHEDKIKTSKEIEEELYIKFPMLRSFNNRRERDPAPRLKKNN